MDASRPCAYDAPVSRSEANAEGGTITPQPPNSVLHPTWTVLAIALAFLLFHAALASVVPLVEDEAYYALWASVPAWGYYDHPPMIAWWIAAGNAVFGHTEFGVRALSTLAFGLVTLMTARTAFLLGGAQAAIWAALLLNATLVFFVMGFAATPDAPSVFFWSAAIWAVVEWRSSRSPWWWLLIGLCVGLGVLSKFTNLFLAVGFAAWGLLTTKGRKSLRVWQLWAGVGLAVAVLMPTLIWNAANDWVGIELQFGRIGDGRFSFGYVAEFVAQAVLAVTPLIAWLAIRGAARPGTAILLWLNAPLLVYLAWHGLSNHIPPNWLTPLYPAIAVLAGLSASHAKGWVRRAAAPLGLAIGTVPIAYILWHGAPVIPGHIPFNQVRGWDQAISDIRQSEAYQNAEWVATTHYGLTGTLWWYLGEDKPVWSTRHRERYLFREPFPEALCDQPAVEIVRDRIRDIDDAGGEVYEIVTRHVADTPLYSMRLESVDGQDICPSWVR